MLLLPSGTTRVTGVQEALMGCSSRAQCAANVCGECQGLHKQWYLGMAVAATVTLNSALPCLSLSKNDAEGMP